MEKVRIKTDNLKKVVKENREKYVKIRDAAKAAYAKEAKKVFKNLLKRIDKGEVVESYVSLPTFTDHLSDYDRVLKMIEYSDDTVLELTKQEFNSYVLNQWNWRGEFLNFANSYISNGSTGPSDASGLSGTSGTSGANGISSIEETLNDF